MSPSSCTLPDLPQESVQCLAGFRGQGLEASEINRVQVADVLCHLNDSFHLSERTSGNVEIASVLSAPALCAPLRDVDRDTVGRSPKLVG